MLNRRRFLQLTGLGAACAAMPRWTRAAEAAPARPNIVVILVDDMGFSDIGCYGSEIPTPHLDRLAANGLRFTQFYNAARCCPTRASLLTGLYAHQAGVGDMNKDLGQPGYIGRLNDRCVTIAEALGQAGYFTALSGKWHLGQNQGVVPWKRGFTRSLNSVAGGFYYSDATKAPLYLNGREVPPGDPALPKEWYTTDLWTDFGIRFIDEALAEKKPFFLYLAHNAPHYPLQAPMDEIAKFRGTYKLGWDRLRDQRRARQIEMGIMDAAWPISPRPPEVKAWDAVRPAQQDRFDHIMAIYAAVVAHMDASVGRLVEALKRRGVFDNTVILFMSDNGGNAVDGPNGTMEGNRPGDSKSKVYCGQSWATLQNTPLVKYKRFTHEGGIATPLIAHWPAGIPARGELRTQVAHVIDILPTCLDLAGARYPATFNGHTVTPVEGRSLVPAFANRPIEREALYWEHEGHAAIRAGDWKLVRQGRTGAWELYNLKTDRAETKNLAAAKPDLAGELAARWETWAKRANVKPYPGGGKGGGGGGGGGGRRRNREAEADE